MTIYVAIDLADERYCDDCPVRDVGLCRMLTEPARFLSMPEKGMHWLRPQACIDASVIIETGFVNMLDIKPLPEQGCYIDGKRVLPGGLADAIAEAEEARK